MRGNCHLILGAPTFVFWHAFGTLNYEFEVFEAPRGTGIRPEASFRPLEAPEVLPAGFRKHVF